MAITCTEAFAHQVKTPQYIPGTPLENTEERALDGFDPLVRITARQDDLGLGIDAQQIVCKADTRCIGCGLRDMVSADLRVLLKVSRCKFLKSSQIQSSHTACLDQIA